MVKIGEMIIKMNFTIAIFFTLCTAHHVFGTGVDEDSVKSASGNRRKWYSPHFIPVQYAGNIGFISSGVGYIARKDNYQIALLYGYAPESLAGVRVHTLTAKNDFHIYRFNYGKRDLLIPYASLGVSLEVGGRSFFMQPSNMPEGYYDFPKSIHLIAAGGLKVRHLKDQVKYFRGVEFFIEATTVDAYIWYKFISDEVKMHQIMTLSLGMNFLRK